jgi:methionine aminopeptidase
VISVACSIPGRSTENALVRVKSWPAFFSHQHPIDIGRSGTVLVAVDQVLTADGSCAAHWEYTVAVIEDEPRILAL